MSPELTFNWGFEYHPISSKILTQLRRYKIAENDLLPNEKVHQHWIQIDIYLYFYIYSGLKSYSAYILKFNDDNILMINHTNQSIKISQG